MPRFYDYFYCISRNNIAGGQLIVSTGYLITCLIQFLFSLRDNRRPFLRIKKYNGGDIIGVASNKMSITLDKPVIDDNE